MKNGFATVFNISYPGIIGTMPGIEEKMDESLLRRPDSHNKADFRTREILPVEWPWDLLP